MALKPLSVSATPQTTPRSPTNEPILTFKDQRYDLNALPDDLKELVRGMQVADAQLRMHEDTLKVSPLAASPWP